MPSFKIKLIFPSTYVYGNPKYLPIDENHPIESTNPYSESKIAAERLCIFYKEKYELDVKILRLFNIYGIGQDSNFLIPKIIEQAFLGEINLENSAPKRDFVYLDDVISAHIKAGSVNHKDKIIFNIGSGKSISVDKVAKLIAKKIGNDIKIKYSGNIRKGEISNTIANIKLSQMC